MLELIRQKRIKDKFRKEFGATIEEFFDDDMHIKATKEDVKDDDETQPDIV